ncbi:MAG: IS3 family transposase [Bacillota bacterium]
MSKPYIFRLRRYYNHERFKQKFNNLSPIEYRTKVVA